MLYGSIPFSMGGLTALSTLYVRESVRACATLACVSVLSFPPCPAASSYLNQNQFSGTIPTSLGSLTQMTGLMCVRTHFCYLSQS